MTMAEKVWFYAFFLVGCWLAVGVKVGVIWRLCALVAVLVPALIGAYILDQNALKAWGGAIMGAVFAVVWELVKYVWRKAKVWFEANRKQ